MKLLFLGTGAAIHFKKPESEIKEGARRSAAMLIDGTVLVDVCRQAYDFAVKKGVDTSAVTDIFLSHAHDDHFNREALHQYIASAKTKLRFWCHRGALAHINFTEEERSLIDVRPIEICDKWETTGMTVTALPANHLVGDFTDPEQPLHYIFEKNEKTIYYGCDGGWYTAIEWEYLRKHKVSFDAVIMDATVGEDAGNYRIATHNNLAMLELLTLALRQNKMLNDNALLIANHLADMLYSTEDHREQEAIFAKLGMVLADDGKIFEI